MFLPALSLLCLARILDSIWSLLHLLHFIHLLVLVIPIRRISANQVLDSLLDAIDMRLHVLCYEIFIDLFVRFAAFDFSE